MVAKVKRLIRSKTARAMLTWAHYRFKLTLRHKRGNNWNHSCRCDRRIHQQNLYSLWSCPFPARWLKSVPMS
ncbi:transposase [Arthrospira sp. O9.13F]|nr:transposase [Arthrospira sp. O9.13F]